MHWATSSSSPKHEARLGLAAGAEDECSSTVRSDKRTIKIKAGHMAPNTQLWWQREDNGQRGGPGRPSLSHSPFYFYWAVILYTQLYSGDECALFTVHKCSVLITSKLQAGHRSICYLQICMEGISKGKKGSVFLCENTMSCV